MSLMRILLIAYAAALILAAIFVLALCRAASQGDAIRQELFHADPEDGSSGETGVGR